MKPMKTGSPASDDARADHEDIAELTNGQKRKEELNCTALSLVRCFARWRQHPVE